MGHLAEPSFARPDSRVGCPYMFRAAPRFQYKYPGTPTNTMAMLNSASSGRFQIVFRIQAAPIST
jgi:hypothetical protein